MSRSLSLKALASACDGELVGDPEKTVQGVATVGHANSDQLTFIVDAGKLPENGVGRPGVLLVRPDDQGLYEGNRILVANPYRAYATLSGLFASGHGDRPETTIHPSAQVADSASIGEGCLIGPCAVVGEGSQLGDQVRLDAGAVVEANCVIGSGCVIESNAVIAQRSRLGQRCAISPGATIGSSGFGYAPSPQGWQKIHQLGGVRIGDDVDVGSNATIDRGAIDDTIIGDRVKIDNHVQIAHNVEVGDDTIMAAFVGVAGSAKIGKRCQFGGRSSIMGHITICDETVVHTNTFVARSIDEPGTFSSMLPAQPASQWRKTVVLLARLDKLSATVRRLGKAQDDGENSDK